MDFAILADHTEIQRKRKKRQILRSCQRTKITLEYYCDGDTSCNWCTWNDLQKLSKRVGGVGNRRASGDHLNQRGWGRLEYGEYSCRTADTCCPLHSNEKPSAYSGVKKARKELYNNDNNNNNNNNNRNERRNEKNECVRRIKKTLRNAGPFFKKIEEKEGRGLTCIEDRINASPQSHEEFIKNYKIRLTAAINCNSNIRPEKGKEPENRNGRKTTIRLFQTTNWRDYITKS